MADPMKTTGVDNKWSAMARAIDGVLLADSQQVKWLGVDYPPFTTPLPEALKFYGGVPGAKFDLWVNCRAAYRLRQVWVGEPVSNGEG